MSAAQPNARYSTHAAQHHPEKYDAADNKRMKKTPRKKEIKIDDRNKSEATVQFEEDEDIFNVNDPSKAYAQIFLIIVFIIATVALTVSFCEFNDSNVNMVPLEESPYAIQDQLKVYIDNHHAAVMESLKSQENSTSSNAILATTISSIVGAVLVLPELSG